MTELNDYQTAKEVIGSIKVGKQTTVEVKDTAQFRKYFAKLSKEANQSFATKLIDGKILIIRTK